MHQYPTQSVSAISGTEREISRIAYALWQEAGWPTGRFMEFWEQAERQVIGAREEDDRQAKAAETLRTVPFAKEQDSTEHSTHMTAG